MAKSADDRGRGARMARRDEGAYCLYVTEEQRSQPGCIGREGDRLSHSRALSVSAIANCNRSMLGTGDNECVDALLMSAVRNGVAKRTKVLVVDDDPSAAELVGALLELQGHEVFTAQTPLEALSVATRLGPEIAFLDIGLPKMTG